MIDGARMVLGHGGRDRMLVETFKKLAVLQRK